jgi:NAD-dependent deacetylase
VSAGEPTPTARVPGGQAAILATVAARLAAARRVTVLTGAGVSAASGVPTFRGPGGLWRHHRPESLATPEAFARDPRLVWEWYDWRRQVIAACRPNRAHDVLAAWSRERPGVTVITQNVDGLHEHAGLEAVIRLHGSIWEVGCARRCHAAPRRWRDDTVPLPVLPPACPHCGGLLRPGVVWFGEELPAEAISAAVAATACDVFITAGTSAVVYPAAGLVEEARERGAWIAEVDPNETAASSRVDAALRLPADVAFDELAALLVTGLSACTNG